MDRDDPGVGRLRRPDAARIHRERAPVLSAAPRPPATSASVTASSTSRRLALAAIQTSCSARAGPAYSRSSGRTPRTQASGPSIALITSATVISAAGLASQ